MATKPLHPAEQYARDVIAGRVLANKWVRLACQRHVRDLKTGSARGLYFDEKKALRALRFFGFLRHSKGEWAGRTFELAPWQQFILWCLFGWMRADGTRRFRDALIGIPRKNGKSTLAAGVALYLLVADKEPGAQVFSAATKKDQAKIVHSEAQSMVSKSPSLRSRVVCTKNNLAVISTGSKFEPLGKDSDTLDGLNPQGNIIDEYHAHKDRGIVDVLETATGARRQPLTFKITTAGSDKKHSPCGVEWDYAEKVLEGILENDAYFAYLAGADEGDDWTSPATWQKANPNYNVSVKPDNLMDLCTKAQSNPSAENAFKRLRTNVWTEQETRWLSVAAWDACAGPLPASLSIDSGKPNPVIWREHLIEKLRGRRCKGGLDLSSTTDVTALVLLFPPEGDDPLTYVLPFFWIPADNMAERVKRDRVPYDQWQKQGFLFATEGNIVDYAAIRRTLTGRFTRDGKDEYDDGCLAERFSIDELAFDRWGATQITTELMSDGMTVVPVGQGFASMSAPTKHLETMVLGKRLAHGANPVLRWMASNLAVETDAAENLKPSKKKARERIDGMVALIMGISRMIVDGDTGPSVYEGRGIITL